MTITLIMPFVAAVIFLTFGLSLIFQNEKPLKHGWIIPAIFSIFFLIFSVYTVFTEGLLGFWGNHTMNFWGNQVWFDLLFACGIGWLLIIPEAKKRKMCVLLWFVLITSTGCIGFLAMVARLMYLREHSEISK